MINILLSVRRPFSGKILSGEKKWELRKNVPRLKKGDSVTLWLYESGMDGTRDIIGKCRLVVTAGLRPYPPKGILEWTMKQACVTEEHILHLYSLLRLGRSESRAAPSCCITLCHWTDPSAAELAVYH